MSKQTSKTTSHEIGARVLVLHGPTKGKTGTVELLTQTGWYRVRLDSPPEDTLGVKDGCVSARATGLSPIPETPAPEQPAPAIATPEPGTGTPADEAELTEEEQEEAKGLTPGQQMAKTLREARVRYVKAKTVNGTATAHCNDLIARELQGLEPLEVAELADRVLNVPAGTHQAKYGHLNPGQIRMNSGNRIRAYWKALAEEGTPEEQARVAHLLNLDDAEEDEEDDTEE